MGNVPFAVLMLLCTTGCTPTDTGSTADSSKPAATMAPPPRQDSPAVMRAGAAGKMSADQVGKLTPVPAFKGGGTGWRIDIQSLGDMRHSVRLATGEPAQLREGTVVYQPSPPTAAPAVIILDGTLYDAHGDRAIGIKLARHDCTDAAGRVHQHEVQVDVAGERTLQGCGDLAVY